MYTYPESMTLVARYLLPELDESACCLHCRQKLHIVNPVAIHRLCGIVLCESCFSKALIDYHSSLLVGRAPPCCPSCHHSLTEENFNLTLPPLRYAVQDSLSHLTGLRWRMELEMQQALQAQNFNNSYGFGHVYEPVLFGGKNALGEEFMVLPDGTAVRAKATAQPIHYAQLEQKVKDLEEDRAKLTAALDDMKRWKEEKERFQASSHRNNGTTHRQRDQNRRQPQGKGNWRNGNESDNDNDNDNRNRNRNRNNKRRVKR